MEAAIFDVRIDFLAPRTIAAYSSEVKLYEEVVGSRGLAAWPVSQNGLVIFGGVLRAAGYKAGNQYLSAVMTTSKLLGYTPSPEVRETRSRLQKALERGQGSDHQMAPISPSMLQRLAPYAADPRVSRDERRFRALVLDLMTVGVFFMLRSEEILTLKKVHVLSQVDGSHVKLLLPGGKTNQEERMVVRQLSCVCGSGGGGSVCPVCAVGRLVANAKGEYLSSGKLLKRLGYNGFLEKLRLMLADVGEQTFESGSTQNRFGTHSLRRGGRRPWLRPDGLFPPSNCGGGGLVMPFSCMYRMPSSAVPGGV